MLENTITLLNDKKKEMLQINLPKLIQDFCL